MSTTAPLDKPTNEPPRLKLQDNENTLYSLMAQTLCRSALASN